MTRVNIPVVALEFDTSGNTVWIHGPGGVTVARIKTMGKITTHACEPGAPASHFDVIVDKDIKICLDDEAWQQAQEVDE